MPEVTVSPATADRFDDAAHALTGGDDGASCWCQWWMLAPKDYSAASTDDKRERLRDDLAAPVPSALIAYVDGEPAGWVKVAPRTDQPRLARTRSIQQSPEPIDDPSVWAITCFVVRREHRGVGVARTLLDAAVAHAGSNGARLVEAYPVDTDAKKSSTNELFHGTLSSFLAAGFTETARPGAARPIVAKELA
ncbi:GNAT family N-acetyltransferase [Microbacterium sp. EYE_5]|uniref:GNAT family N-acetyltransferase n=1 Tax=unclassified Microbacterium TaxID=2609290 RepID=UPI002004FC35|nr:MULTISPECIES: GNAT family N-acetyltransferase [unclassified Microbacterium]MCK6080403.1 GNAT family N-acetyltransferase [Microbacterium sp. EYE_382]MCK6085674.1 GNAT family N-acetyltransferase [Microbacterium sp. EYE_384]MCK6124828.1 GNAT family N-acetyltransferase [Microbacterium sp. EYE_80]MCK6127737.1 GNAT family N-acetyltransferase [Microbacterium sp. EYE_79]MCK6141358.1 GNAT family N-acetyltransferase [Microbacterium sp. EYE_39]